MIKAVTEVNRYTTSAEYSLSAITVKRLRVSNNLSELDVVGSMDNDMVRYLKQANIGSSVSALAPSCFVNCGALVSVRLPETCRDLHDAAFYGCSSLASINLIQKGAPQIQNVGNSCFYGCESLTNVELNLYGANRFSQLGDYAFANCVNLTSVTWTGSSFIASHMFSGCEKLTDIKLPNKVGYVYPYGFAEIPNLQTMTIPNKIWFLNDHMFEGCGRLTSVVIQDGDAADTSSVVNQVGDFVFNGCDELREVTLPKSITSFSQIGDNFLAGSSVSAVRFNGIPASEFGDTAAKKTVTLKYETGKWYSSRKSNSSTVKPGAIIEYAAQQKIPIVVLFTNGSDCTQCTKFDKNTKSYVLNKNYFYLKIYSESSQNPQYWTAVDKIGKYDLWMNGTHVCRYDKEKEHAFDTWPHLITLWTGLNKKADGKKIYGQAYTAAEAYITSASKMKSFVEKYFSGYKPQTEDAGFAEIVETSRLSLFGLNLFGGDLSCVYYASDGSMHKILPNGQVSYVPTPVVDKFTTRDFKYGTWYYNASKLKPFVDAHNIPVLIEYSSEGCDPCEYWKNNVFKSQDFQKWVASRPYMFCRIEIKSGQKWNQPQNYYEPYFLDSVWVDPGQISLPVFCWYWKKPGQGEPTKIIKSYHFNPGVQDPPWSLEELERMTDQNFAAYVSSAAFVRPEISSYMKLSSETVQYRCYSNYDWSDVDQSLLNELSGYNAKYIFGNRLSALSSEMKNAGAFDEGGAYEDLSTDAMRRAKLSAVLSASEYLGEIDPNGVFLPCEQKNAVQRHSGQVCISVDGALCCAVDMGVGDRVPFKDATYQFYLYSAGTVYKYDMNSLVFKVADGTVKYMYSCTNDPGGEEPTQSLGYARGTIYRFDQSSSAKDVEDFILQGENDGSLYETIFIQALSSDDTSGVDSQEFLDWAASSGRYFAKITAPDQTSWSKAGTPFAAFSQFTQRGYVGQWVGAPQPVPCVYRYMACRGCSPGDPIPTARQVFSIAGKTAKNVIDELNKPKQA